MIIIYPQADNKLAIAVPCISVSRTIADLPPNTPYKVVPAVNIDNRFFDAYDYDDQVGIRLNIERAKEIKRNMFRHARKPLLEKLDVQYILAIENSDTKLKRSIAAQKKQLRDITQLDLPSTIDELISFWPDVLDRA